MLLRLLALARAPVELAEAKVAVGDEGAQAEFLGESERIIVVTRGVFRRIAAGRDLAEQPKGPRLVGALAPLSGKGHGSLDDFVSVLEPVGEHVRLSQMHQEERVVRSESHGLNRVQSGL